MSIKSIIAVETLDGWVDLNGDQAVEPWPWEQPLHVLSAWSRFRSENENLKWYSALMDDLWAQGLEIHKAFTRTEGVDPGDWIAVAGLSRPEVIKIARRYGQEVFFEVNKDEVMVVGVNGTDDAWVVVDPR